MNRYILSLFSLLTILMLASCHDDFIYETIGEGEALVEATVKFHPLIATPLKDNGSRTPGDAIKTIRNIQIFIFSRDNKLIDIKRYGEPEGDDSSDGYVKFTNDDIGVNEGMPDNLNGEEQAEAQTMTVKCGSIKLPFGRYRMYAVANYKRIEKEDIEDPDYPEETANNLKKLRAVWSQTAVANNDQMFGCFADDNQSEYQDAPILVVNRSRVDFNAWIQRLASKVTIVYDGRNLHPGIDIYIKSVSIRDIPTTCTLGFSESWLTEEQKKYKVDGNCPTSNKETNIDGSIDVNGLIGNPAHGTLYYETVYQSAYSNEVDEVETSDTDPKIDDYKKLLTINSSVTAAGAVLVNKETHQLVMNGNEPVMHQENMQALFFYENCQGNYVDCPDKKLYDKQPYKEDVGKPEDYTGENPDDLPDNYEDKTGVYKDNVPYGTYIEVDAFYRSTNPDNQTSGVKPIKYRFMLGQNDTYNYNALRNRHYKLTLSFRGYANQPEWHIVYDEEEPGLYPRDQYFVSYLYNTRHEMPIRLTGNPYRVTLQIIENSWAPYDENDSYEVAKTYNGTEYNVSNNLTGGANNATGNSRYDATTVSEFRWYRELYTQQTNTNYSPTPTNSPAPYQSTYYYGLHSIQDGNTIISYDPKLPDELLDKQVSPIWVGFLALQVPKAYEKYSTVMPTSIANTERYDNSVTIENMYDYYRGKGGIDSENNRNEDFKLYECSYDFSNKLPDSKNPIRQIVAHEGDLDDGRNAATLKRNDDGSYTLIPPIFTMPKDIGNISGFSGNNPYESFQRKAVVLITAYYHLADRDVKIVKQVPVYQVERLVNPKGVWRTGSNNDAFNVRLMYLDNYTDANYKQVESDGEWSAWVATPKDEMTPKPGASIYLTGGDSSNGGIIKGSGFVDFTINFRGDETHSHCEKVIVKYNGNCCEHAILVRKGYDEVVQLADASHYAGANAKPAKWSSFNIFAFQEGVATTLSGDNPTTNLPGNNLSMTANLTNNPLALGTLFKRGNYAQGIGISNNAEGKYTALVSLGTDGKAPLELINTDSEGNLVFYTNNSEDNERTSWPNIKGIAKDGVGNSTANAWEWSTFTSTYNDQKRKYDLPTYEDAEAILKLDIAAGVVYADGATETRQNVRQATGYFNVDNDQEMEKSLYGMRGIIVYNSDNFNQIFFPIGYSGIGRRTVQLVGPDTNYGYLRYGAVYWCLTTQRSMSNQYRPISFNMPASPGTLYWLKKPHLGKDGGVDAVFAALDINYFDLNLSTYSGAVETPNGDAIPIKPVYIEDVNN